MYNLKYKVSVAAFVLFFCFLTGSKGQESPSANVVRLHDLLVKDAATDKQKARSFYDWIANNIRYDITEWKNSGGKAVLQQSDQVLSRKLAICHGYSALFKQLCDLSEINCYMVSGYLKREGVFEQEGHTWNLLFIDSTWQQVDVTWAAGGVDQHNHFIKQYDSTYFLQDPVQFLHSHYPFDPMWQLVEHPVKLKTYRKDNWVYNPENNEETFHFRDTISNWMILDSVQAGIDEAERMMRFTPGDQNIERIYSHALAEAAVIEMNKGNEIVNYLYNGNNKRISTSTKRNDIPPEVFRDSLSDAEKHYLTADSLLVKAMDLNKTNKAQLQQARNAVRQNLNVIKSQQSQGNRRN